MAEEPQVQPTHWWDRFFPAAAVLRQAAGTAPAPAAAPTPAPSSIGISQADIAKSAQEAADRMKAQQAAQSGPLGKAAQKMGGK